MKTMMLSKLILVYLFILPLYNVGAQVNLPESSEPIAQGWTEVSDCGEGRLTQQMRNCCESSETLVRRLHYSEFVSWGCYDPRTDDPLLTSSVADLLNFESEQECKDAGCKGEALDLSCSPNDPSCAGGYSCWQNGSNDALCGGTVDTRTTCSCREDTSRPPIRSIQNGVCQKNPQPSRKYQCAQKSMDDYCASEGQNDPECASRQDCPDGQVKDAQGQCVCGGDLTSAGPQCVCLQSLMIRSGTTCSCPTGMTKDSGGYCRCPEGKSWSSNRRSCVIGTVDNKPNCADQGLSPGTNGVSRHLSPNGKFMTNGIDSVNCNPNR